MVYLINMNINKLYLHKFPSWFSSLSRLYKSFLCGAVYVWNVVKNVQFRLPSEYNIEWLYYESVQVLLYPRVIFVVFFFMSTNDSGEVIKDLECLHIVYFPFFLFLCFLNSWAKTSEIFFFPFSPRRETHPASHTAPATQDVSHFYFCFSRATLYHCSTVLTVSWWSAASPRSSLPPRRSCLHLESLYSAVSDS